MLKKWFSFPVLRAGAITVLAITLLMAFPTTRAFAGQLLNLFRVQQVEVLSIDSTGLENMTGNEALGSQLSKLISDSTVVTDEPGEPVLAANASDASTSAGFNVRLPADSTPSKIYVTDSSAFALTVDRDKAQALIEAAGRSDLVLPQAIDGAEYTADMADTIKLLQDTGYATSRSLEEVDTEEALEALAESHGDVRAVRGAWEKHADANIYMEVYSPTRAPESDDLAALYARVYPSRVVEAASPTPPAPVRIVPAYVPPELRPVSTPIAEPQ